MEPMHAWSRAQTLSLSATLSATLSTAAISSHATPSRSRSTAAVPTPPLHAVALRAARRRI